jgi:hypothetical protein
VGDAGPVGGFDDLPASHAIHELVGRFTFEHEWRFL